MLSLPIPGRKLVDSENVLLALEKLEIQGLLNLQYKSDNTTAMVVSVNLDRLSRIAENMGLTGEGKGMPKFTSTSDEELEWLLNAPSLKDRENRRVGGEIQELLTAKFFREQLMIEKFQSAGGSQLREFCPHKTREDCRRSSSSGRACPRLRFRKIFQNHTDESLGDCSFLNTCFHLETCKFMHYTINLTQETEPRQKSSGKTTGLATLKNPEIKLTPPQWINCDIRSLDMSILGKFTIIMADPPWDIHMELPYEWHGVLFVHAGPWKGGIYRFSLVIPDDQVNLYRVMTQWDPSENHLHEVISAIRKSFLLPDVWEMEDKEEEKRMLASYRQSALNSAAILSKNQDDLNGPENLLRLIDSGDVTIDKARELIHSNLLPSEEGLSSSSTSVLDQLTSQVSHCIGKVIGTQ